VAAGLLFTAIGLGTAIIASDYPLGTTRNIGPGCFPIMIGIVLTLLGVGVAFQGMSFSAPGPADEPTAASAKEDEGGIAIGLAKDIGLSK
jgi:hypothetical protein